MIDLPNCIVNILQPDKCHTTEKIYRHSVELRVELYNAL
jgi:hypothetical protein